MVMACCNLCYEKYLDEQGEVDINRIKEIFGESSEVQKTVEDKISPFTGKEIQVSTITVLTKDKAHALCTCCCHNINSSVMH